MGAPSTSRATKTPICSVSRHQCGQWEIWQVEWEHFDDGLSKDRPALVISSSAFNASHDHVYFAKISSVDHADPFRISLPMSAPGFQMTGLRKDSHFYLGTVRKVPQPKIRHRRGALPQFSALIFDATIRRLVGWQEPRM